MLILGLGIGLILGAGGMFALLHLLNAVHYNDSQKDYWRGYADGRDNRDV